MRRIFPPVVFLGLTLAFGKGVTAPITPSVPHIPRLTGAIYPQEWEGIWTFQDSAYSCTGTFLGTQTSPPETVCTGEDYGGSLCSVTIDATTLDATCAWTRNGSPSPGCDAHWTSVIHATLSVDSYFMVIMYNVEYSGGVCQNPPACFQQNSHAT